MNIDDSWTSGLPMTDLSSQPVPVETGFETFSSIIPTVKVELTVPENPKPVDFVRAYFDQIRRQADIAEEEVFDAELAAANAERIAQAKRAKAERLRQQAEDLKAQIRSLEVDLTRKAEEMRQQFQAGMAKTLD